MRINVVGLDGKKVGTITPDSSVWDAKENEPLLPQPLPCDPPRSG